MSASKRRRGAATRTRKHVRTVRASGKGGRGVVARSGRKPVAKAAKRPAPAKSPRLRTVAALGKPRAGAQHAPPTKRPKVILPHEEAPKDVPAHRAAVKPPPAPKKPKPPAKTMQVPRPETAPLLQLSMPDIRRASSHKPKTDVSRGHLRPDPAPKTRESSSDEGPLDASLMTSSLASEIAPKVEDNYDYSVLDDFRTSKWCPAPTRMVNTGCGGGEAAVYFSKLGYSVVGIDSDRAAVGLARERAWLQSQDVDFMVGDLFDTPNLLPAESFGLALDRGAFHRLETDRDRQRYLANIRRLLFQGGVFYLSAGFFPLDDRKGPKERRAPRSGHKLLLVREGGVVVNELRQAGFDLSDRVLRRTADSGDYGELLLSLRK